MLNRNPPLTSTPMSQIRPYLLYIVLISFFFMSACTSKKILTATDVSTNKNETTNTSKAEKAAAYKKLLAEAYHYDDDLIMLDHASTDTGAHIFIPKILDNQKKYPIVAFVHGYGAMNPKIYGGWIRHLVQRGNIVIYPRYQEKILKPAAKYFVPNTVTGIISAFDILKERNVSFDKNELHLVGHSYGAVIISNIAANADSLNIPKPKTVFACQGGTGPLKGGLLTDYSGIDANTIMAVIVGDNDQTVGTKFGEFLFSEIDHLNNAAFIHQYEKDGVDFTASHYEPYCIDETLDNKNENFTSKKAVRVSRHDDIDELLYWAIFDEMMTLSKAKEQVPLSHLINKLKSKLSRGEDIISVFSIPPQK